MGYIKVFLCEKKNKLRETPLYTWNETREIGGRKKKYTGIFPSREIIIAVLFFRKRVKTRKRRVTRCTLISSSRIFIILLSLDAKLIPPLFMFKATYAFLHFSRIPVMRKRMCALWCTNAARNTKISFNVGFSTWFFLWEGDDNLIKKVKKKCNRNFYTMPTYATYIKPVGQILRVNTGDRLCTAMSSIIFHAPAHGCRHCVHTRAHTYTYMRMYMNFGNSTDGEQSCWEPVLVLY